MTCFVDTAAFIAVLDRDDACHQSALTVWRKLLTDEVELLTSSYVLVETNALVQNRLGLKAVKAFYDDIYPLLIIEWVKEPHYHAGITGVIMASRKKLSLVDCVSFDIMRSKGIKTVFTFDRHFKEQGFTCLPANLSCCGR